MAKKADKADPQEKARRALVKAQLKLEVAQEEHNQQRVRGQQEVEKARLQAQKWLAKAAQRVERRANSVTQAEAALAALTAKAKDKAPKAQPTRRRRVTRPEQPAPAKKAAEPAADSHAGPSDDAHAMALSETIPSMPDSIKPSRPTKRRAGEQTDGTGADA